MSRLDAKELRLAANTLRCLAADEVQAANSGHPGVALGLADVVACLWLRHLKVCGDDPAWADRDRFVMSGGHASALLYAVLHLAGFGVSLDDLRRFRQLGARTPGHPEFGVTPGVETTTGPLGQGIAAAVGMALAERMLAARLNAEGRPALVDHRTWVTCGDGDLEEGVSHEACSLAGALGLGRLTLIYDSNDISIEGPIGLAMADDTKRRFEGYGWRVLACDGHVRGARAFEVHAEHDGRIFGTSCQRIIHQVGGGVQALLAGMDEVGVRPVRAEVVLRIDELQCELVGRICLKGRSVAEPDIVAG